MEDGSGKFEEFMRQTSLRSLFTRGKKGKGKDEDEETVGPPIPQLSPFANAVVARCCRFLLLSTDDLQQKFEKDLPDHVKQPSVYARNLLEYCSYQTLHVLTKHSDYLADKAIRKLTFDMMLAWEIPSSGIDSIRKENVASDSSKTENEDDGSFFYKNSTSMAAQVDCKKTVGAEAFSRIAPACPVVADVITVHNLFDALTSSSGGQLHFLIWDKYLGSLDKVYKFVRNISGPSPPPGIRLAKGELILDVDGATPTQPVFQHIGITAWPGRLTLTTHALYFESLGVGSYDKPVVYDLATDLKQVIKPDLTGPLGVRLFDKAVMYKSSTMEEPVNFEFPEFKGHSRRDYWLAIIREINYVNIFIRKFNLRDIQQAEALSKAVTGILQYRALKEAFHAFPSHFKTLLSFNLTEELPKGDEILEALYNYLKDLSLCSEMHDIHEMSLGKKPLRRSIPVSLQALTKMGLSLHKDVDWLVERAFLARDSYVGETNPLELAVNQSLLHSGPVEVARATVEQVKVEGLDTNLSLMKELLFPLIESYNRLQYLAAWEDLFKSTVFLVLIFYIVIRGWIAYVFPCILMLLAIFMLWNKHRNKGKPLEAFTVTLTASKNPVEQLLTLQEAISQLEALAQEGNIIILKLRAILYAALPQTTSKVAVALFATAVVFAFVPFYHLVMLALLELYTREMPLRKQTGEKLLRRMREWWIHIPAAPVQLIKPEESKKKK